MMIWWTWVFMEGLMEALLDTATDAYWQAEYERVVAANG